jgi:HPt (histidine-containing phosphotransfer) domain-containing protein
MPVARKVTVTGGAAVVQGQDECLLPATDTNTNLMKAFDSMVVFDEVALQRLEALDPTGQNLLLLRVMKAFDMSLQRMSSQLVAALAERDTAGMRHVVHTLKSSAASVGALRLSQLCLEFENDLRGLPALASSGPVPAFEASVADVVAEMQRVQAGVPQVMSRADRAPGRACAASVSATAAAAAAR